MTRTSQIPTRTSETGPLRASGRLCIYPTIVLIRSTLAAKRWKNM